MNLYSVDVMFNLCKIRTSERSPHLKMLHSDFCTPLSSSFSPPSHPLTSFSSPPLPLLLPSLPSPHGLCQTAPQAERGGEGKQSALPPHGVQEGKGRPPLHDTQIQPVCISPQHMVSVTVLCLFASGCRGEGGGSERACFKDQPWLALTCHW